MDRNSTVDKMVAYMNDKYDDHFEYAAPFGGGPGAGSKQIIVSSEQYPQARIWVQYYEQDGKEVFTDNYIDYKYEEQTRAFLQELLEQVFQARVVLRYDIGSKGTVNDFNDETTFEAYISDIRSDIGFQACVLLEEDGVRAQEYEQKLKEAIESAGLIAFGTIYFTVDPEIHCHFLELPQKTRARLDRLRLDMDGPNSFRSFEWRLNDEQ